MVSDERSEVERMVRTKAGVRRHGRRTRKYLKRLREEDSRARRGTRQLVTLVFFG